MVFDFRLARACDFDGIQEIFAHYVSNTVMTLVHNVPSTLGRIQHTTEFPRDEDDETPAYPVYLPVPVLVAHHITDDGKKPQIVGYTFLGPARNRDARNSASMELYLFAHPDYVRQGIGGALLSMLLTLVHSSRGIRCFEWVIAGEEEELFFAVKPYKTTRITVSVSVDPDSEDGGEWLPEWFKTKGFVEYKRLKGYSVKFNRVIDTAYLEYTVREIESDESDPEPESEPDSNVDGSDNEVGNVESNDTNGNGGNEGHAGST